MDNYYLNISTYQSKYNEMHNYKDLSLLSSSPAFRCLGLRSLLGILILFFKYLILYIYNYNNHDYNNLLGIPK